MSSRFVPSDGTFVYLLGLVVIATRPGRFWLGLSLALVPIAVGTIGRVIVALSPRRDARLQPVRRRERS